MCAFESMRLFLWVHGDTSCPVCVSSEELEKDVEFEVVGDAPEKAPAPSAPEEAKNIANGNQDSALPSTSSKGE